jgi:predicted lipoprotein
VLTRAALPVLLLACLSPAVQAQNTDWTTINLAMTDAVVIPAFNRFADSTKPLATDAAGFCTAVTADSLKKLQQDFTTAMDGWQGVQHVQFGPDDKGTGSRQLDTLLAARDPKALEATAFAQQSVGVQGFPALERLLFSENSLKELQSEPYRCQVVQAIARNLDEISNGVAQRWRDEFRTTVAKADERGFFESAQDATIDYLKAVVESVRRVQRQKLEAVLGDNQAAARERRA